ncbi:uncharacterized protein C8R40DRAFT_1069193 [Lentinula edodes]|uniref:uncharacterized protein n=1 Tax=Lentinula edodes TaxID=5353 RepID=UPI001E8EA3AA|nr:uncharacterized protein C8R40DRAFT_1069193 [Lentinula edodes]KAH7875574.1 hypothetical protein C8R40DRAFT_1069193 [Lentinula edodes]
MTTTLSFSDSSILSTPELSSPSSASSSNDSSSFYSAVSSGDWNSIESEASLVASTPISSDNNSESGYTSPYPLSFPSKANSTSASVIRSSVKNIASSNGIIFGSSFGEQRRADRRRPTPLPLVDPLDEILALPLVGFSAVSTSLTDVSVIERGRSITTRGARNLLGRRESSHVSDVRTERMRLQRVSSLPSIPSATLDPFWELSPEALNSKSEKAVQFDAADALQEAVPRFYPTRPSHLTEDCNTNAMASLAWTGTLPSALPSSFPIANTEHASSAHPMSWTLTSACRSTWSLSDSPEPGSALFSSIPNLDDVFSPIPRSNTPVVSEAFRLLDSDRRRQRRRWTLAMVITDDRISDEKLVEKLDRMMVSNIGGHVSSGWQENTGLRSPLSPTLFSAAIPSSNICASPREELEAESEVNVDEGDCKNVEKRNDIVNGVLFPTSNNHFSQSTIWKTARRTLLICRELVRTERSYLSYLQVMLSQETMTPPPAILLAYLPALVQASEKLLSQMEMNPSAAGVAEAFLACEDQLELAFLGWCGIIGGFFAGAYDSPSIKRARTSSASFGRKDTRKGGYSDSSVKRRVGSWGKRLGSFRSRSWSMSGRSATEHAEYKVEVSFEEKKELRMERYVHSVRDLAILPTQRVMRYTLLFRDLGSHMPSPSASHEKVQMALEATISLAQKCNNAQGNSVFLHEPR